MTNITNPNDQKIYNIKDRTACFAVNIINFINNLPKTTTGNVLSKQLIRSGTSVGANIEEADGTNTKKDFVYKLTIARKEARETKYWLKIIKLSGILVSSELDKLFIECEELIKILSKIITKSSFK